MVSKYYYPGGINGNEFIEFVPGDPEHLMKHIGLEVTHESGNKTRCFFLEHGVFSPSQGKVESIYKVQVCLLEEPEKWIDKSQITKTVDSETYRNNNLQSPEFGNSVEKEEATNEDGTIKPGFATSIEFFNIHLMQNKHNIPLVMNQFHLQTINGLLTE